MDQELKKKVLYQIKPSLEEQEILEKATRNLIRKLKKEAKKSNFKCDFFIGGSFGKGTYLKGKSDIDIFCRFDLCYDDNLLSVMLEKLLLNLNLKYKKQKGSRDYFSLNKKYKGKNIEFELVPIYKISNIEQAKNSTDISPMHVQFLKKQIEKNPFLQDEIRLAKQFFKAKKLYGAESYINGFSGHSIDILISYYKSFENLIFDAKTWKEKKIIDISNFYCDENDILKNLDNDKFSNLILIDPILKTRNAAKALSEENYARFLLIANLLDEFKKSDFELIYVDFKDLIKNNINFAKNSNLKLVIYEFSFKITNESEDIVGSKLKRLFNLVSKYFIDFDFSIFKKEFFIDMKKQRALFFYFFEKKQLSNIKIIYGPKVFMQDAVKNFLKLKKDYFVLDMRVCSYEKRVIEDLKEIYKLDIDDFSKLLNRDFSFVKKVKSKLIK